jgi:hypothetical protein
MNANEDALAVCPYYRKFKNREIQCEACLNRARIVFVFHSAAEAIRHKRSYCDTYAWEGCPYARMMVTAWNMDFRRVDG